MYGKKELETNLLGQLFHTEDYKAKLKEYKAVARMYAHQENSIAVLSDLKNHGSFIYSGELAKVKKLNLYGKKKFMQNRS